MSKVRIMTGNQAAAVGATLSGVQVVAAYPITPQSQLAEIMSQQIEGGKLESGVRARGKRTLGDDRLHIGLYRRRKGVYRHERQRPNCICTSSSTGRRGRGYPSSCVA